MLASGCKAPSPIKFLCARRGFPRAWRIFLCALAGAVSLLVGLPAALPAAGAQANALKVEFIYPNAAETFYAGPSSLIYRVPVKGLVSGFGPDARQVQVQLEIYQGEQKLEGISFAPEADGTFERYVTANPHGALEDFTIAFLPCGDQCHRPGELDLAAGDIRLALSVTGPDGQQARAERRIRVDYGRKAAIPVRVLQAGTPGQPVPGVSVAADARLYEWRSRSGKAVSDAAGLARLEVEALSLAPTRYRVKIEPSLVDGVLYRGAGVQEITLPAGALDAPEIVLYVTAERGAISGALLGGDPGGRAFPVWAVRSADGKAFPAKASPAGEFTFQNLPVGAYLVAADEQALAQAGLHAEAQALDLSLRQTQTVELALLEMEGSLLAGRVSAEEGSLLPFAWVTSEILAEIRRVSPLDGAFTLESPPGQPHSLAAGAPGYYSQARLFQPGESDAQFSLVRRPDTRVLAWGSGSLLAPPETAAAIETGRIELDHGWLWGQGSGVAWVIVVGDVQFEIETGAFALEAIPGQAGWFYLLKGQATARSAGQSVSMQAPQMLALDGAADPVRLEPAVYQILHDDISQPLPDAWQPSLQAQLRDRLARLGISTAQALTSLAYGLGALALPLGLFWWIRRKRAA